MPSYTSPIASRQPEVGTSIFTTMTALAHQYGAINLSQGFPDFDAPPRLIERVVHHMRAGMNQYAPMVGVAPLRAAIAAKVADLYGVAYDVDDEINVTAGATQAIYTAITAMVSAGDEVMVFEPAYDSYVPAIRLAGGKPVYVRLTFPDYRVDWHAVRRAVTRRTRMIIVNTPNNPTTSVFSATDMQTLADIVRGTDIVVVADEVYEHIVFDGARHESVARYPQLACRSFVVSSFGKTYHVTGWKLGYCLAPKELMAEFRKTHQYIVFTCNNAIQLALADFMREPAHYLELANFYAAKRDAFVAALASSRFVALPSRGTYFQLCDYSALSDEADGDFVRRMTREFGVAAIPVSAFYHHDDGPSGEDGEDRVIRFCFAKTETTLARAAEILCRM